jgi:predicted P-loop ATPase
MPQDTKMVTLVRADPIDLETVVLLDGRSPEWREGLQRNSRGGVLGNFRNVTHTLRNAPEWSEVLGYDEFAARVITKRSPYWGGDSQTEWDDHHDRLAWEWFQEAGIPAGSGVVGAGIQTVAMENRFHPVRNYLDGLRWDGQERLDTWPTTYLGAPDTPYVRAVGSRFLTSAVARIFEPGCKVDHMLTLEGPQGRMKSSALRVLAHPWFTDHLSKVGTKDAALELAGTWLVEVSELDALAKAGQSAIKSFLSRQVDRFRPPYGRRLTTQRRQCVFAGTINPNGPYLKDRTGARRFWPIACGIIDLDALRRDRDQLWAEAVVRFRGGNPWWLESPELESLAGREQEQRMEIDDPWSEGIERWLVGRTDVSIGEVLIGALGKPRGVWTQAMQNRVATVLQANGFQRYRPNKKGQPRTPRYRREGGEDHGLGQIVAFKKSSD